jgi:hypothetical protein
MLHWYIVGPDQTATINIGTYSTFGYRDSRHDIVLAMMAWAENDTAPNEIVATKWKNDTTMKSRASVQSATLPRQSIMARAIRTTRDAVLGYGDRGGSFAGGICG